MLKYTSQRPVSVMYPQGRARRVPSVCRVLVCHCVIALQTTSDLPLLVIVNAAVLVFFRVSLSRFEGQFPQGTPNSR